MQVHVVVERRAEAVEEGNGAEPWASGCGGAGVTRHVCGTEGTVHIQPLDNPSVRLTLAKSRGDFRAGTHEIAMPRYVRYVDDAADMARVIRGEKPTDFSYEHDLAVQRALLQACRLPLDP